MVLKRKECLFDRFQLSIRLTISDKLILQEKIDFVLRSKQISRSDYFYRIIFDSLDRDISSILAKEL